MGKGEKRGRKSTRPLPTLRMEGEGKEEGEEVNPAPANAENY